MDNLGDWIYIVFLICCSSERFIQFQEQEKTPDSGAGTT